MRIASRVLVVVLVLLATAWAAAAIWVDGPESRSLAGVVAGAASLAAVYALVRQRPWWRAAVAGSVPFVIVLAWWLTLEPRNDRDWQSDVARAPSATVDGSSLIIRNVRSFVHRADGDSVERWETRTYDLDKIVGADLFISFWGPTLYGHTIASWEFADGQHLAISIETRKEKGEQYSAVRGFFRQFELYYVVADERDVIALRTNRRRERVQLYRTAGSPEEDRALLLEYVRAMNALVDRPRWYNALTHNCTTTIWNHVKAVDADDPFDWRLLANGYLVDLAYELGSVDTSTSLDELKRRSDITTRAREAGEGEDFSRAIRRGLPPRPTGGIAGRSPGGA